MVAHSALTGANLHEPKGVASASVGQVYVADGAGSGTWQKVGNSELDTTEVLNTNEFYLTALIDDVSTMDEIYVAIPHDCTLDKVITVLEGALTDADAVLTFRDDADSSAGTITVAFTSSAAKDVDTLAPASNNVFSEDDVLTIETDGGSTGTQKLFITMIFTKT